MKTKTEVIQNLKCGGCANTITKELSKVSGVQKVSVNNDENTVTFEYTDDKSLIAVEKRLGELGYPIDTDPNSLLKKAKSYVSCAVGRLTDDK